MSAPECNKKKTHWLLIDDHQLFNDGFSHLIGRTNPNVQLSIALNINEGLRILDGNPDIDLILLDLTLPGLDGISFLKSIREKSLQPPIDIKVVIISALDQPDKIRAATLMEADGFIPKSYNIDQMCEALEDIREGRRHIPQEVHLQLRMASDVRCARIDPINLEALGISEKQVEILQLLADGLSVRRIGEVKALSPNTIKSHIKKIYEAFNVNSRVAAIAEAHRLGILTTPIAPG